jgi:hypothetical protein
MVFFEMTALLPSEPGCNITAAAWIDYDGDGRPDSLLATGFHSLRLYRNLGRSEPIPGAPAQAGRRPPAGLKISRRRWAWGRKASAATSRATRSPCVM